MKNFFMKRILVFLLLFICGILSAQISLSGKSLYDNRTEFSQKGNEVDSFLNRIQKKILFSFGKAHEHFTLIFDSAEKEGKKAAKEKIDELSTDAVNSLQKKADSMIGETFSREQIRKLRKYADSGKTEKKSSASVSSVRKEEKTGPKKKTEKEKKKKAPVHPLDELIPPPEDLE